MLEVLLDSLKDSAILLGIVFALHVLLSFFEGKIAHVLEKSHRFGPLMGSLFGIVPQCGTSVVGADLYLKDHLTIGTVVAIFLACSDEALPILWSDLESGWLVGFILLACKIVIGAVIGLLVDLVFARKSHKVEEHLHDCHGEEEIHHGCCGHDIEGEEAPAWKEHLLHPLLHSLKIFAYVFLITFAFGALVELVGEETIGNILSSSFYFSPLIAVVIGLIPNCVSSVLLSRFYIHGVLPFGALLAGLLVNAGLGMFVLLRSKAKRKEALTVLLICVLTSLVFGYGALMLVY